MKKLLIYVLSLLPNFILVKFENLFSVSQGRGFSDPIVEANNLIKFAQKKKIDLKTIFDVGSFHGDYTKEILKKYPKSSYYLFEPDQENYLLLKKSLPIKKISTYLTQLSQMKINQALYFHTAKDLFKAL